MAYADFDRTQPDGSTDNGAAFATDLLTNLGALWHGLVLGSVTGWTRSVSGGTAEEPAVILFSNGTLRLRATPTWTSGYITSLLLEYSSNSGSSYDTRATMTAAYDGSGNATTGNNSSLYASWLFELIGKFKDLRAAFVSLASSLYDAAAVAITGGTITGVAVTASTVKSTPLGGTGGGEAALATVLAVHEKYVDLGSISGGGTATVDCAACAHARIAPAGNFTLAFSNVPAAGFSVVKVLELVNCNGKTITLPGGGTWGSAGAPTFSTGTDLVQAITRDGGSTWRFVFGFKG